MYVDSRGLSVTASEAKSVELLDEATLAYLGMRKDTALRAVALVESDEDCILGYCLNGYLAMHACREEQAVRARKSLGYAKKIADTCGASQREQLHLAALDSWCAGKIEQAIDCWEKILSDFPLDILALRLAQFMTSYMGRSKAICDSVARVLPAWDEGVSGFGFVLSCYAYGLEEAGDYKEAERHGRRALDINPKDLWGAHALTHVMEMQGRPFEGVEWVEKTAKYWEECGNFVNHLWWHCALFQLSAGNYTGALELYDRKVNVDSDEYLDVANASALLWRLEQAGADPGKRWEELASRIENKLNDHFFVFIDLHYLLATAAKTDTSPMRELLASCIDYAEGDSTEAGVMRDVGIPIANAVDAHRRGAYSDAADFLLPVQNEIYRIGGSHAQRDLFEQMLIDSVIRADRLNLANSLLQERARRRPGDVWAWRTLAVVSERLSDLAGAAHARAEVARILGGAAR